MAFGYTPERAEQVKNQLDRHGDAVEHRFRRIKETVPDAATPVSRLDELLTETRGVIEDLHDLVDQRTNSEGT
jgi:hypothetical protein